MKNEQCSAMHIAIEQLHLHGSLFMDHLTFTLKTRLPMPIQLMLSDLAIEGIAVDAQNLGGFSLISARFDECSLNESLFKLA